ncbi:unnamed protein product, partial [Ectocarpus sp. 8 AP-2014]
LPVRAGTGTGGETSPVKSPGLSRIQSEGGLTNIVEAKSGFAGKQRGLVAGRPSRERSGFVAADAVKKGLGPAGAFAGNSNWRVEAGREKEKSAADVKGDGHGGFHNPMAALRAQQQQQRAQQQQARRVRTGSEDWQTPPATSAGVDEAGGGISRMSSPSSESTSTTSPRASGMEAAGTPADPAPAPLAMPAWMLSKG